MTQFEMITSTELSGRGMASISPLRNSTFVDPGFALVFARQGKHLVGHVEPVSFAGRPHTSRRKQHIDATAGTKIEYRFARIELRQRRRIAASQ